MISCDPRPYSCDSSESLQCPDDMACGKKVPTGRPGSWGASQTASWAQSQRQRPCLWRICLLARQHHQQQSNNRCKQGQTCQRTTASTLETKHATPPAKTPPSLVASSPSEAGMPSLMRTRSWTLIDHANGIAHRLSVPGPCIPHHPLLPSG